MLRRTRTPVARLALPRLLVPVALLVAACATDEPLPTLPDMAVVDLLVVPAPSSCTSKGQSRTCPAGQFCVSFEGGGVDCRDLPARCAADARCSCIRPGELPNGTCDCVEEGPGSLVAECH